MEHTQTHTHTQVLNKTLQYAVKLKQMNTAFTLVYQIIRKFRILIGLSDSDCSSDNKVPERSITPSDKVLSHLIQGVCLNFRIEGGLQFSTYLNSI